MICFIALFAFTILGVFSATHRRLAWEAFDCVFRRITFRKCESGLNERLKSRIVGKVMVKSPRAASMLYRHFEIVSWAFTILFIVSLYYSADGMYNYAVYGNCNGPDPNAFCIFNPMGNKGVDTHPDYSVCGENEGVGFFKKISTPTIDDDPSFGNPSAKVKIIEFGCFTCAYSKKAAEYVKKIKEDYSSEVFFVFRDFPLSKTHEGSEKASEAAQCANDQNAYWDYYFKLYEQEELNDESYPDLAKQLGLNTEEFTSCIATGKYKAEVEKDLKEGLAAGIYGTPTFFINDKTIVGPNKYADLKNVIEEELK